MPTPARTSLDAIVAAGRAALERDGLAGLTMQHVASAVGVRAPSLYKHVRDRDELVRLVVEDLLRELRDRLTKATGSGHAASDLRALAHAFRAFARAQPNAFGVLFSRLPDGATPDPQRVAEASEPVLRTTQALVGSDEALPAARTVTAWATGFVRMELSGGFQLGGGVDEAFDYGIDRITEALGRH